MRTRTPIKTPIWRLSRCVAKQEPCLTRLKMPVSSLGGAADSGQGLVGVHKIARERGYLLPLQPSYSCQQANSVLTSSAAGFQGRASHIADVQAAISVAAILSRYRRKAPLAPAATPANSPGRRRPAIPAQHPSNGDRATVDAKREDGNHDHQAIKRAVELPSCSTLI